MAAARFSVGFTSFSGKGNERTNEENNLIYNLFQFSYSSSSKEFFIRVCVFVFVCLVGVAAVA